MSNDKIEKARQAINVAYDNDNSLSPLLRERTKQPHIAFLSGNGSFVPIVAGCSIALISDRSKINGIAIYTITKMSFKPGKEVIEMVALGNQGTERRILRLGSRYFGHHTPSLEDAESQVNAVLGTKDPKVPGSDDD